MQLVAEISRLGGEEAFEAPLQQMSRRRELSEKAGGASRLAEAPRTSVITAHTSAFVATPVQLSTMSAGMAAADVPG